jgi:hypothetical protein
MGDVGIAAGINVELSGWGAFDGTYFVESVKHSAGGSGYVTAVEIREGGPSKKKKRKKKQDDQADYLEDWEWLESDEAET